MKQGKIFNICAANDNIYIEEYTGWLDLDNDVGYYKKSPNGRWHITELKTGCKFGDKTFETRKRAIEVFTHNQQMVIDFRKTDKYAGKVEFFNKHCKEFYDRIKEKETTV